MDWFIFVLISLGWLTSLFLVLETKTAIRVGVLAGFSMLLGSSLLTSGVSFPTGWTIVTSGATQTITQTFTNYTQANNAWILGFGWALLFMGLYLIIEVWTGLINTLAEAFDDVKNRFGIFQ